MSSTSGSCVHVAAPHFAQLGRRSRATVISPVGAVPGGDPVAPPELARDAPVLDVLEEVVVRLRPLLGDDLASCPSRTAASAGSASGFIFTNHCVEIIGSTTPPERWQRGSVSTCGLRAAREALLVERLLHGRARVACGPCPANGPRVRVHRAVEVEDVDLLEPVALAGREVVEVVRRRHLHGAGAELRVDEDRRR